MSWSKSLLAVMLLIALLGFTAAHENHVEDRGDHSMVFLPDTQGYSSEYNHIFPNQTRWIVENEERLNIEYVAHLGDIVGDPTSDAQWNVANESMWYLWNNSIPHGVVGGNHDSELLYGSKNTANQWDAYETYFGEDRFSKADWWGGSIQEGNAYHYDLVESDGVKYVLIGASFTNDPDNFPVQEINNTFSQYDDRYGILYTHCHKDENGNLVCGDYNGDGNDGNVGPMIEDLMETNENFKFVTSGHHHGEWHGTRNFTHRLGHEITADYQSIGDYGDGFLRLHNFFVDENKMQVQTWSPYLHKFNASSEDYSGSDADNLGESQFTLETDLQSYQTGKGRIDSCPSEPFCTDDSQPQTQTLTDGESFTASWSVEATGTPGNSYTVFGEAESSDSSVSSVESNNVTVSIVEPDSKGLIPNSEEQGSAFHIESGDSNPQTCNGMSDGDTCTFSASINASGDLGSYEVFGFANSTDDSVARADSNNVTVEIVEEDTSGPSINVHSPQNQTYSSSSVDLNVTSDETVDTWEYSLDGGANQSFTPNTSLSGLSDGGHTVDVYATDSSGNTGSESVSFTVDTSKPEWRNVQSNITGKVAPPVTSNFSGQVRSNNTDLSSYLFEWNVSGQYVNKSYNLQDGFEDGDYSSPLWQENGNFDVQVSNEVARYGNKSMLVTGNDVERDVVYTDLGRGIRHRDKVSAWINVNDTNRDPLLGVASGNQIGGGPAWTAVEFEDDTDVKVNSHLGNDYYDTLDNISSYSKGEWYKVQFVFNRNDTAKITVEDDVGGKVIEGRLNTTSLDELDTMLFQSWDSQAYIDNITYNFSGSYELPAVQDSYVNVEQIDEVNERGLIGYRFYAVDANNDISRSSTEYININQLPSFDSSRVLWTPESKNVYYNYTDPNTNDIDTTSTPGSGSITRTNTSSTVTDWISPFNWFAQATDYTPETGADHEINFTTHVENNLTEDTTGPVNESVQTVNTSLVLESRGDPVNATVNTSYPSGLKNTVSNGYISTSSAFTGNKTGDWKWEVDQVNENIHPVQQDANKQSNTSKQFVYRNKELVSTGLVNFSNLKVTAPSIIGTATNSSDRTISLGSKQSVNQSYGAEGDFLDNEANYDFTPSPSYVTLGTNYLGSRHYQLNNTVDVDFSNIDITGSVASPEGCSQNNQSQVTVQSSSLFNQSVEFNCDPGNRVNGTLSKIVDVGNDNHTVYYFNGTINVTSNETRQVNMLDFIDKTELTDFADRTSSPDGYIDGSSTGVEVTVESSQVKMNYSTDCCSSSPSKGLHSYSLTYNVDEEDTTEDGGSGGGGGGTPSTGSETIYFGSSSTSDGLEQFNVPFNSTVERRLEISNTEQREITTELIVGNEPVCEYIEVRNSLNSDEFSDSGLYTVPAAELSNLGNIRESSVDATLRFSLPSRAELEDNGVDSYTCSFDTSSSYGSAEPLVVEVDEGFDWFGLIDFLTKEFSFDLELGSVASPEGESRTFTLLGWQLVLIVALIGLTGFYGLRQWT